MFDLTSQERKALLLLSALLILGLTAKHIIKDNFSFFSFLNTESNSLQNNPVNINTAAEENLTNIPGIGPVTAAKIVAYRGLNGPFKAIEDLKQIKGIGDKKLEVIKKHIILD